MVKGRRALVAVGTGERRSFPVGEVERKYALIIAMGMIICRSRRKETKEKRGKLHYVTCLGVSLAEFLFLRFSSV